MIFCAPLGLLRNPVNQATTELPVGLHSVRQPLLGSQLLRAVIVLTQADSIHFSYRNKYREKERDADTDIHPIDSVPLLNRIEIFFKN